MFIDRKDELQALEERWKSPKAEFMVLYGRRRVGKTELIDHFIEGKSGVRLLGRIESEKNTLDRFSADLATFFKDDILKLNPFQNYDALFTYIAEKTKGRKIVIAIDEFPYLVDANRSLPSILQDHWDRRLSRSKIFLILCGSSVAMMLEKVLGHKSPLYGRRTGQLKVEPMKFSSACLFFHKYSVRESVYAYAILGGTPGYLMEFDDTQSIEENIREKLLRKDRFLFQDAEFILKEELREPKFYFSILRAIAIGKTRIGDIMNETGLEKGMVGKYLSVLSDLDMVDREVPVTERQAHKSRRGIYILKDNFFKFYFNFISPNIELIERKQDKALAQKIMERLDQYTSRIFEDICRDKLWDLDVINPQKIGRWWQGESEIDIIAVNEDDKAILFAECKWQDNVDAHKILRELQEKAKLVEWHVGNRKENYAIFARSFKGKLKEENAHFFDLDAFKQ